MENELSELGTQSLDSGARGFEGAVGAGMMSFVRGRQQAWEWYLVKETVPTGNPHFRYFVLRFACRGKVTNYQMGLKMLFL